MASLLLGHHNQSLFTFAQHALSVPSLYYYITFSRTVLLAQQWLLFFYVFEKQIYVVT